MASSVKLEYITRKVEIFTMFVFRLVGIALKSAKRLAKFRDGLPTGDDVRMLSDGASAKFCDKLYPCFCRFEKGLRSAIAYAMCADYANFNNEHLRSIEESYTLEKLYGILFTDDAFLKSVRGLAKNKLTKAESIERINSFDECILWDNLFDRCDMPTFRERRDEVKDRRNDVMHFHCMSQSVYTRTLKLMDLVNDEIDSYLSKAQTDISYTKAQAKRAGIAYQAISTDLADALKEEVASTLLEMPLSSLPSDKYFELVLGNAKNIPFDYDAFLEKYSNLLVSSIRHSKMGSIPQSELES